MYGVVTWIFQDGHLSGLLGFTPNGTISPTIPVLMFAIMFGLSMDYEVFLLSRIRERYVATGDNTGAIASGLQRTGGVITSAALLLVVVIGMFSGQDRASVTDPGYFPGGVTGGAVPCRARRAGASWLRELMPSLVKTFRRW
jgi:uncharacterized membrane protein YdfJ with MMPL/SSD domain